MAIQRENVKRSPLGSTLAEEGPDFTSADVDDVSAQQSAYTERVARKGGGTSTSRVALGTKANKGRTQVDSSDTSQETVIGDSALPTPWSPLSNGASPQPAKSCSWWLRYAIWAPAGA